MQYEESDWEFLLRNASKQSYPVFPEVRSAGVEVCIGLPLDRDITPIDSVQYRIRSQMNGPCQEGSQKNLVVALEYILEEQYEEIAFGEPVQFMERTLWVVEKQTYIKYGYLLFDYKLRLRESCRVNSWLNKELAGAAVCGNVTATSSARSKLSLKTDGVTESAESWHVQGLYYTGKGAGYSGSPEKGDTQYLYFPTDNEADRYVIGGAGTNYEQIEQTTKSIVSGLEKEQETAQKGTVTEAARQTALAGSATGGSGAKSGRNSGGGTGGSLTPEEVTAVKSWTTPKKQSVSLSGEGVRLATGGGISLSLTQAGITVQGKGDMTLEAENIIIVGKQLRMNAKSYIYFKCQGAGIAILPSAVHILGYRVYLQDNAEKRFEMNNKRESASVVEQVMQEYEERLRGPAPLFAADGSAVRREGFDEFVHTEAQFEYFEKNIWGKDERYPNTGGPSYTAYQSWLTDTYGKSTAQKINDVVFSLDSLQVALDIAGFVLPPADLVNAVISLARGKKLDAAIDFVSAIPWLGDQIKYSHMISKIGKTIDGLEFTYKVADAATAFSGKVAKTLDALDAAMGAKREYQLVCNGITITVDARTAAKMLDTASDTISTAKSMAKYADVIDNVRTGGKIVDNLSDVGSAVKSGSNVVDAAKAIEGAGEASKYIYRGKDVSSGLKVSAKILDEAGDVISITKSIDLAELAKLTGHSVEELTDILKYLGMNADELAKLLNKADDIYDILGVSPRNVEYVIKAYQDIADYRKLNGFGEYFKGSGDTVAGLKVFDETIFATNSTITKEIAEATIEQRRKWFKEIQWSPPKSKIPRDLGRTQSLSHAEAQTLLNAFEKYGSNLPKSLEMCVDRVTCGICISELPIVLRHIGVEELIVYSGGSTIPQIIKAVH